MNIQLPDEQIEIVENSERIKTHPIHFSGYYVNDEVNAMLNYSIDYCYHIKAVRITYEEAIKCEQSVKWKVAMKEEMDILKETFESMQLPPNKTLIPAR